MRRSIHALTLETIYSFRYPDDDLFKGPQDEGISQSFLESFTAIFVLNKEQRSCGTRYFIDLLYTLFMLFSFRMVSRRTDLKSALDFGSGLLLIFYVIYILD